jgi:hypothetical protein
MDKTTEIALGMESTSKVCKVLVRECRLRRKTQENDVPRRIKRDAQDKTHHMQDSLHMET